MTMSLLRPAPFLSHGLRTSIKEIEVSLILNVFLGFPYQIECFRLHFSGSKTKFKP